MPATQIYIWYSDTRLDYGTVHVNRPGYGQYILSLASCDMGEWNDSDLKPRGDVRPGGTVFYYGSTDSPRFRLGGLKASAREDYWSKGFTGTGHTFTDPPRPLAWKVLRILDD